MLALHNLITSLETILIFVFFFGQVLFCFGGGGGGAGGGGRGCNQVRFKPICSAAQLASMTNYDLENLNEADITMNMLNYHIVSAQFTSWGKEIKCEASRAFYRFFAMSLINLITQEHEC